MLTSDFDYLLPLERIAQTPIEPRHDSRLLVIDRKGGEPRDDIFKNIEHYLDPGDLLVINQTRVIPARLFARKRTGGRVELLLLKQREIGVWEALVGGKGLHAGVRVTVEGGPEVEIVEDLEGSQRVVRFLQPVEQMLPDIGVMPLPPYIHTKLEDPERYQTVYARITGSAAAPTAGLHFTPWLIEKLQKQGIQFARVTLHVGLDTFAPVNEEKPEDHHIHTEWCELPAETAAQINQTKMAGKRVIAVGTTSVRVLETAAAANEISGQAMPFSGQTGLFILPGFNFQLTDAMITNFHLPRSTLLMLVSAFAGRERMLSAYQTSMERGYRFYSFGDAMLIL